MSPRPRTVEDSAILDAAFRALSRIGPERLTLADIGAAAGLSAATLVQRFGSKRDLLLSLCRHTTEAIDEGFLSAVLTNDSPLDSLFTAAIGRTGPTDGPASIANRMAFLLSGIDDPEFHEHARDHARRVVEGYKGMLDSAIKAGELSDGYIDTAQLAETIYALNMGTLMTWTIIREGNLGARIRRDLDTLIRPFRRGSRKTAGLLDGADRPGAKLPSLPPVTA